jgi:hypothetical protein
MAVKPATIDDLEQHLQSLADLSPKAATHLRLALSVDGGPMRSVWVGPVDGLAGWLDSDQRATVTPNESVTVRCTFLEGGPTGRALKQPERKFLVTRNPTQLLEQQATILLREARADSTTARSWLMQALNRAEAENNRLRLSLTKADERADLAEARAEKLRERLDAVDTGASDRAKAQLLVAMAPQLSGLVGDVRTLARLKLLNLPEGDVQRAVALARLPGASILVVDLLHEGGLSEKELASLITELAIAVEAKFAPPAAPASAE